MIVVSRRAVDWLRSLILLCIVVISWGYVLYAARQAALWQLQQKYPNQVLT
ncbi:small integral membrane protein 27 isoform X2 [Hyla sarda]|uniref:small integral membrane protein 27 isoform X2 n=1 Tax=Hyla sarda TaxID=327740 RepID=UPI0024C280DF|nr:small integral membrane protein 27 isoform X2 [Hyla sarda]